MRGIGILLMAISAAGYGFLAAERVKQQLEFLTMFRKMIYHLKNRILYANAALSEAVSEVGERFQEGKKGIWKEPGMFFCRVSELLEQERDLSVSQAWKKGMKERLERIPLSRADRINLEMLGENLGYADREMQERTLQFYLEQTDDAIAFLKTEVTVRGKLYRALGAACGIFIVVFLI